MISACPRCSGQLMTTPELTHKGWQRIPTCIQCGYEVFERPEPIVEVPGKRRRDPVMPS